MPFAFVAAFSVEGTGCAGSGFGAGGGAFSSMGESGGGGMFVPSAVDHEYIC